MPRYLLQALRPRAATAAARGDPAAGVPRKRGPVYEHSEEPGEEGKQIGIQQGALQGKQHVLNRLIDRKYGITPEERARVQATTNGDALDRALDAIVDADTKAAVLRALG